MTVQELIDELGEYDPDWLVIVDDAEDFIVLSDKDNEEVILEIQG